MSKFFYLVAFVVALICGYLFYDNYYYQGNSEIVVISPIKYPYKIAATHSENLIANESPRSLYENFSDKKNNNSTTTLVPEPETPIFIEDKKSARDIFLSDGVENEEFKDIFQKNIDSDNNSKDTTHSIWENIDNTNQKSLKIKKLLDKRTNSSALKNAKHKEYLYYSQLGYYRSPSIAKSQWEKIKTQNKKLLSEDNFIIKKVKNKNNFHYELNLGPYKDFKLAKHICKKIILKNQKCVVIKD